MKISVHVGFAGDCEAAFATYARVLGGTVTHSLRYRDSPMANHVSAEWGDKLYHATMTIGDLTLMGGDHETGYQIPEGFMLVLNPSTIEEAHRVFDALAEGGTVQMPIQETFWSPAFGVAVDRFGMKWSINCEAETA
jgi:PhnB protein